MVMKSFTLAAESYIKVDMSTMTHYHMDERRSARYIRAFLFSEAKIARDKAGHYVTSKPWFAVTALQWIVFNSNRKPALLIKVIEQSKDQDAIFFKVATPPYFKKTKVKSEFELMSFVPWQEAATITDVIPPEGLQNLSPMLRKCDDFGADFGVTCVEDLEGWLNFKVDDRLAQLNLNHEARMKQALQWKCPNDEAQQVMMRTAWAKAVDPVRAYLESHIPAYECSVESRVVAPETTPPVAAAPEASQEAPAAKPVLKSLQKAQAAVKATQAPKKKPIEIESINVEDDKSSGKSKAADKATTQASGKRDRSNGVDKEAIVQGKRERKKRLTGDEEEEVIVTGEKKSKKQEAKAEQTKTAMPKKNRPTFPGGYNTKASKVEGMYKTLMAAVESNDPQAVINTLGAGGSGPPKPQAQQDKSLTQPLMDANEKLVDFYKEQLKLKDAEIAGLKEQLEEARLMQFTCYKQGVREAKGIKDSPQKNQN